jgi:hypothetical protein
MYFVVLATAFISCRLSNKIHSHCHLPRLKIQLTVLVIQEVTQEQANGIII